MSSQLHDYSHNPEKYFRDKHREKFNDQLRQIDCPREIFNFAPSFFGVAESEYIKEKTGHLKESAFFLRYLCNFNFLLPDRGTEWTSDITSPYSDYRILEKTLHCLLDNSLNNPTFGYYSPQFKQNIPVSSLVFDSLIPAAVLRVTDRRFFEKEFFEAIADSLSNYNPAKRFARKWAFGWGMWLPWKKLRSFGLWSGGYEVFLKTLSSPPGGAEANQLAQIALAIHYYELGNFKMGEQQIELALNNSTVCDLRYGVDTCKKYKSKILVGWLNKATLEDDEDLFLECVELLADGGNVDRNKALSLYAEIICDGYETREKAIIAFYKLDRSMAEEKVDRSNLDLGSTERFILFIDRISPLNVGALIDESVDFNLVYGQGYWLFSNDNFAKSDQLRYTLGWQLYKMTHLLWRNVIYEDISTKKCDEIDMLCGGFFEPDDRCGYCGLTHPHFELTCEDIDGVGEYTCKISFLFDFALTQLCEVATDQGGDIELRIKSSLLISDLLEKPITNNQYIANWTEKTSAISEYVDALMFSNRDNYLRAQKKKDRLEVRGYSIPKDCILIFDDLNPHCIDGKTAEDTADSWNCYAGELGSNLGWLKHAASLDQLDAPEEAFECVFMAAFNGSDDAKKALADRIRNGKGVHLSNYLADYLEGQYSDLHR